jgi:hypothetical protein
VIKHRVHQRVAVPKPVRAELDEVDEAIVRMKAAKYKESQIADHVQRTFGITYVNKTIGTRYTRIKRALTEKHDKMLEGNEGEWHTGDVSGT